MTTNPEQRLRDAGLRVTLPRVAVLQAVHDSPHADTGTVLTATRAVLPTVSHQAVYDCLDALTGAGLIRRIQPSGSLSRYETRTGDNHHHAVCRACGGITDVDCATGTAPCLDPAEDHGFAIDETEVIYWGLCPGCASSSTTSPPDHQTT